MEQTINEVMTHDPVTVKATDTLTDAAKMMREHDIGDVIVLENGSMCGIATDRDIVVRAIAEGKDPSKTKVGEVCSKDVLTLTPDQRIADAVKLMRDKAVRRVPVCQDDKPIGIVSIGDLALEQDRESALADISAAPPNK